ncbi:MAG TPA: plastocyanin/azurin family copper-binding protein [Candidatus Eisenbacteria bacterium]|nr:plastocyanin/azurin family copper-binding protein [Candidatus Eisenbacteria bacterium]
MTSHSISRAALVACVSVLALTGCNKSKSNNPVASGPTANVGIVMNALNMGANAFTPNPVTVAAGTTVIWKNNDGITHTVTSTTAAESYNFSIAPGSTGSHLFSTAGSFSYKCSIPGHTMNGSVTVTP